MIRRKLKRTADRDMESTNRKYINKIDWLTVILTIGLTIFGLLNIASATSEGYEEGTPLMEYIGTLFTGKFLRQFIIFLVSLGIAIALMFMNYDTIKDLNLFIFIGTVLLLVATLIFGNRQRGMRGWRTITKPISIGLQPGELCKIMAIIVFSAELAKVTEGNKLGITRVSDLIPLIIKAGIIAGLIIAQPDFGTAMIYIGIMLALIFMAKTSWKILVPLAVLGAVSLPILWMFLTPDQKARVYVFLDPSLDPEGYGYNVGRAKSVSSAGGMTGKGLFSRDLLTQKSSYLPEKHTDFIFSSMVEAIGIIGAVIFVIIYLLLIFRLFRLSMRARDDFGAYVIMGVAFMLAFHFIENVGMNIGLMPVTGIPLPLISYGGSNLMTTIVAIGMCVNIDMRRAKNNKLRDIVLK